MDVKNALTIAAAVRTGLLSVRNPRKMKRMVHGLIYLLLCEDHVDSMGAIFALMDKGFKPIDTIVSLIKGIPLLTEDECNVMLASFRRVVKPAPKIKTVPDLRDRAKRFLATMDSIPNDPELKNEMMKVMEDPN